MRFSGVRATRDGWPTPKSRLFNSFRDLRKHVYCAPASQLEASIKRRDVGIAEAMT